jgi:hypothetical protein
MQPSWVKRTRARLCRRSAGVESFGKRGLVRPRAPATHYVKDYRDGNRAQVRCLNGRMIDEVYKEWVSVVGY